MEITNENFYILEDQIIDSIKKVIIMNLFLIILLYNLYLH